MKQRRGARLLAGTLVAAITATMTACGSDDSKDSGPTGATTTAAAGSASNLAEVCPSTIVWQTGWVPQAEHGPIYQMLAGGVDINAGKKRVTGRLVDGGIDTGVKLEVRAGGPAIGFSSVSAQMYLDKDILIGGINTDEAIENSAKQPTVGIAAPDQLSPLMIFWDPEKHSDWKTIADVGKTDSKVLYFDGTTYMAYLIGGGVLKKSQVDGGFDGSPSTFVAGGGEYAQQGYATQDPYLYEHDVAQYKKPIKYQLVNDLGYKIYPDQVSVRAEDVTAKASCLKRLVPVIQRAAVAYHENSAKANKLILDLGVYNIGAPQSEGLIKFGSEQSKSIGMLANAPDGAVGSFDTARVQKLIDIDVPIFAAAKKVTKPGLKADDIVTNRFIDPSINID
ncbi:hypothetical protein [Actinomadura rugatobispora]|uniref:ABC transporter substrate-binding protein n=1 Tax=Actinomadura rugatobispora TaxID=1994 RepID=A0ABW1A454_9ACTN|nr:nitrate ABC transporter substrate-binding protein [Actinomadura rugatobispora]